jgi:hypothetical protein
MGRTAISGVDAALQVGESGLDGVHGLPQHPLAAAPGVAGGAPPHLMPCLVNTPGVAAVPRAQYGWKNPIVPFARWLRSQRQKEAAGGPQTEGKPTRTNHWKKKTEREGGPTGQ